MADQGRYEAALGRMLELALLLNEDMTRSLGRLGLTVSRTHVLWVLRQRGPTLQRVLADDLKVTARTMTGLIDGLVATGFVTREPHPTDRRAALVTFTPHGLATMAAMERDQQEFVAILFGGMPAERFDGLVAGLDDVVARLREYGMRTAYETGEDDR